MSSSLEALRRHRAVRADAPDSRRVWLFRSRANFDHGVPERIAVAHAFMDLVIRILAGPDHLEVHGFAPFPPEPQRRGSFELLFTRETFADAVSWLKFSRPLSPPGEARNPPSKAPRGTDAVAQRRTGGLGRSRASTLSTQHRRAIVSPSARSRAPRGLRVSPG